MIEKYPYTDFNEYNLDWVITRIKDLTVEWVNYKSQMDSDWLEYQTNLNSEWSEMQDDWSTMESDLTELKEYITNYFDNLDVQEEINNKIDEMASDGSLLSVIRSTVKTTSAETTSAWLEENITVTEGVVIDTSLSVAGAAADAKATGDVITILNDDINMISQRTNQLLDYATAEIINGLPSNGSVVMANVAKSVIVPVSVSEATTVTAHRSIITSRFSISSYVSKPDEGVNYVNLVNGSTLSEISIPIDSTIKYILIYFYNESTSDIDLDIKECLKSIMVNYGEYTGYEYYLVGRIGERTVNINALSENIQNAVKGITTVTLPKHETKQEVSDEVINITWNSGYWINPTNGLKEANADFSYSDNIPCSEFDVFAIKNHSGHIVFFDDNEKILGYVTTKYNLGVEAVAPADSAYAILNNINSGYKANSILKLLDSHDASNLFTQNNPEQIQLLYGKEYFVNGRYSDTTNGDYYDNLTTFYGTSLLAVKPDHKYRIAKCSQIVFYNSSSAFISSIVPTKINIESEQDITTPAGASYMAINSIFSDNAVYDMEYIPVSKTERKLDGKTVVCFGDSIIGNYAYGDNIPYYIETETGANVYNVGFGGCRMELLTNDPAYTNLFSMVGIVNSLESGDWTEQDAHAYDVDASGLVYRRLQVLKSIDFSKVDIVTIEYGTNEYGYTQDNPSNPTDCYTYGGAMRYCIEKLAELYPQIKICFFTPIFRYFPDDQEGSDTHEHPSTHGKLTENVQTMIDVAKEYKLPCIDMYYTSGLNILNWEYYYQVDGTHPNSKGRKLLGERYAGELNRLF